MRLRYVVICFMSIAWPCIIWVNKRGGFKQRYHWTNEKVYDDNGTVHAKIVKNCFNTSIYSSIETSGGQSLNLYLNVVCFFNTSVN